MISNCKVGAIVFFVSDLARSVAFYRDTLGVAGGSWRNMTDRGRWAKWKA